MKLLKAFILTGISSFCLGGGFSGTTGGSGGYNVQPGTVTFLLSQGVTATTATVSSLTSGQIVYPTAGGLLTGSSNLNWNSGQNTVVVGATTANGPGISVAGEFAALQNQSESLATFQNSQSASYWNIYSGNQFSSIRLGLLGLEQNQFSNEDGGISGTRWAMRGGTANSYAEFLMVTSSNGLVEIGNSARHGSNLLDISSGIAIGADYVEPQSGTNRGAIAPINGLLVEGGISIGTTTTNGSGINDAYGIIAATVTAQSYTANGAGAGEFIATEATFTVVAPASGTDLFHANSADHAMYLNNNNGVDARLPQIIIGSSTTLQTATTFAGELGACTSGCTSDYLCISTGTIHSFVRTSAQTTACQ